MQNLFVYGSLLFPEIIEKLTGKRFVSVPAVLPDFRRYAVKSCDYPAIISEKNKIVEGLLVLNVDRESMKILTFFEGNEYRLKKVEVWTGNKKNKAVVFIWQNSHDFLEKSDWNLKNFEKNSLEIYLNEIVSETKKEFRNSRI